MDKVIKIYLLGFSGITSIDPAYAVLVDVVDRVLFAKKDLPLSLLASSVMKFCKY